MNKFLEIQNLPKLNPAVIENLSRSIMRKVIKSVTKSPPNTSPGPYDFTGGFY